MCHVQCCSSSPFVLSFVSAQAEFVGFLHEILVGFVQDNRKSKDTFVREGVAGTIGVLSKPTDEHAVQTAVDYALRRRQGQPVDYAPPGLQLFG